MSSDTRLAAEALRTLHRIHRQLGDLKARLARGPRMAAAHQANLHHLEAQLTKAREELKSLRMATDKKQLQLGTSEANVKRRRVQLSEAKTNVEYQALKDEIAAVDMANSVLEDEILEALGKTDELAQRVHQCEAAVVKARQEAEKSQHEADEERPHIETDLQRLQAELAQCEQSLPDEFRELYRRVVRVKGEDALAHVEGEFCSGCNQHIPVNMVNAMMLLRPMTCKSCGRLLYLPEGERRAARDEETE